MEGKAAVEPSGEPYVESGRFERFLLTFGMRVAIITDMRNYYEDKVKKSYTTKVTDDFNKVSKEPDYRERDRELRRRERRVELVSEKTGRIKYDHQDPVEAAEYRRAMRKKRRLRVLPKDLRCPKCLKVCVKLKSWTKKDGIYVCRPCSVERSEKMKKEEVYDEEGARAEARKLWSTDFSPVDANKEELKKLQKLKELLDKLPADLVCPMCHHTRPKVKSWREFDGAYACMSCIWKKTQVSRRPDHRIRLNEVVRQVKKKEIVEPETGRVKFDHTDPSDKAEYLRYLRKMRKYQRIPEDFKCPLCSELVLNPRSWVEDKNDGEFACKSCIYKRKHSPVKESVV